MEKLWAPWRMEYILSPKEGECILCQKPAENRDRENYILFRGKKNFVMLNAYPYNPGHLMIAPYRHMASLEELSDEELFEHFDLVRKCTSVLKKNMMPAGFNIGLNEGKVAGAGIADHVHTHVVPRWQGDTNFMPVVSDTRVLPEALASAYDRLKPKIAAAVGGS